MRKMTHNQLRNIRTQEVAASLITEEIWPDRGEVGDYFFYFCGPDSERAVVGKICEFTDYYPFEDSQDDEYIIYPLVELWVEVGTKPGGTFKKLLLSCPLMFAPEGRELLDMFNRSPLVAWDDNYTRVDEDTAEMICTKRHEEPFYLVRAQNSTELAAMLECAPPLAIYHDEALSGRR